MNQYTTLDMEITFLESLFKLAKQTNMSKNEFIDRGLLTFPTNNKTYNKTHTNGFNPFRTEKTPIVRADIESNYTACQLRSIDIRKHITKLVRDTVCEQWKNTAKHYHRNGKNRDRNGKFDWTDIGKRYNSMARDSMSSDSMSRSTSNRSTSNRSTSNRSTSNSIPISTGNRSTGNSTVSNNTVSNLLPRSTINFIRNHVIPRSTGNSTGNRSTSNIIPRSTGNRSTSNVIDVNNNSIDSVLENTRALNDTYYLIKDLDKVKLPDLHNVVTHIHGRSNRIYQLGLMTESCDIEKTDIISIVRPKISAKETDSPVMINDDIQDKENQDCVICQCELNNDNIVLPCKHEFHKCCIQDMIAHEISKKNNTKTCCPLCRVELPIVYTVIKK